MSTGSLGSRIADCAHTVEICDHGRIVRFIPRHVSGWEGEYELRYAIPNRAHYAVVRYTRAGYVQGVVIVPDLADARRIARGEHPRDTDLPWRK